MSRFLATAVRSVTPPQYWPSRAPGLTLIELLVTTALLAVLLAIGAPSLARFVSDERVRAATDALQLALAEARTEALRRGRTVIVCTGDAGGCSGTTDWESGWIVFVDTNASGALDAGEPVLHQVAARDGVTVRPDTSVTDYVRFVPPGRAETAGGLGGTLRVCPASGETGLARRLALSATGSVRRHIGATACP